jgi:hypothetical protein
VWLSLVKALMIFVYLLLQVLLVIWFERRVIGRMQQRPGPNRNGPFGLLQTLADGMKSMLKEDVRPKAADAVRSSPSRRPIFGDDVPSSPSRSSRSVARCRCSATAPRSS